MRHLAPEQTTSGIVCSIERYSYFHETLHLRGHVLAGPDEVCGVTLLLGDGRTLPVVRFGLPSPDLARRHGHRAVACRFDELLRIGPDTLSLLPASLVLTLAGGRTHTVPIDPGAASADPSTALMLRFFGALRDRPAGHMLEIGSRMRTGALYTGHLPPGWRYTGLDVMEGPNVDVVGDAHQLSKLLPLGEFDAAMSFAVFEHLLMPWKVAVEMNRVMRLGGLGLVMAPQTWPLHEEPCDYFRFSKHSWKALFNRATGFEILEAVQGTSGYVVAKHYSPAAHFGETYTVDLMSCVLIRKVAETALDWPVEMGEIAEDVYPE